MRNPEEEIQRWDERALAGRRARKLGRLDEGRVFIDPLEDPLDRGWAGILTLIPRPNLVVKDFGVASLPDVREEFSEVLDHDRKLLKVGSYAPQCGVITNENFVHGLSHEFQSLGAAELDTGGGEMETFLIRSSSERRQTPEVVQRRYRGSGGGREREREGVETILFRGGCLGAYKSPVIQRGIGVGDDRGEKELLANTQEGYGDAAGDDWLDIFRLSTDIIQHNPDEDMVSSS